MAYTRIFRILALALTLVLLITLIPATPALAVSYLFTYPSNSTGEIGDSINAYGHSFGVGLTVYLYFSNDTAGTGDRINDEVKDYERVATAIVDTLGEIDTNFTVPSKLNDGEDIETVRGGRYYLYATYSTSTLIIAAKSFTVETTAEITIDPDDGAVSTEVTVTGSGFGDEEDITVEYDGDDVALESGDDDTDSDGEFEFTILIPESTAGEHTIKVTGDDSDAEAEAEFTVESEITISPESGAASDTITISGTGFGDRADVTITFDDVEVVTDETTDSDGSFEATFAALARGEGSYDVEAEDDDSNSDKAEFTIAAATVSLSATTGKVGDKVTVTGTGFQASKSIPIIFENDLVETATTDEYGKFTASFTVPACAAGTYEVRVSDGTNTAKANFSISTSASISPVTSAASPGYISTELTVSGVGFIAGRTVAITYDGNQVATTTVLADGTFSATFNAPASSGGEHTIIATDGANTKPFTFTMESDAPPTPAPLKPEMGIKAKAEVYFDWEDATDPSGATYTLQIATDEGFSANSIVLEKTGLTQSEYTLTKEERLPSVNKEAPYYWHVKAVDGASNESQWTGTGWFYVGFSLALPQPIIYTLFGVGALLLGLFCFWLGRKTAYY